MQRRESERALLVIGCVVRESGNQQRSNVKVCAILILSFAQKASTNVGGPVDLFCREQFYSFMYMFVYLYI